MKYYLWLLGWTVVTVFTLAIVGFGFGGIFLHSDTLGGAAGLSAGIAVASGIIMLIWGDVSHGGPAKPLPRADRKRLRDEERRLRLEAQIRHLEQETRFNS